ncbi:hypothetical protein GCM10011591_23280 [Nocardia camponoti]|uniref:Uncharacterized protein n=1 Tax=Nocardia camponoti TaxID=1616106 RepID=A0A917V923_9NOCA|nr:hypothetical protein GCM10011591_23280 [Nocardia camponoti]
MAGEHLPILGEDDAGARRATAEGTGRHIDVDQHFPHVSGHRGGVERGRIRVLRLRDKPTWLPIDAYLAAPTNERGDPKQHDD